MCQNTWGQSPMAIYTELSWCHSAVRQRMWCNRRSDPQAMTDAEYEMRPGAWQVGACHVECTGLLNFGIAAGRWWWTSSGTSQRDKFSSREWSILTLGIRVTSLGFGINMLYWLSGIHAWPWKVWDIQEYHEQQARNREMQAVNYPGSTSFIFVSSSILRRNWDICECRSSVFWNKKPFHMHKICKTHLLGWPLVCIRHLQAPSRLQVLAIVWPERQAIIIVLCNTRGKKLTCSSSGSGSGNELTRYSICFALTIKSVTISFWLAETGYSIRTWQTIRFTYLQKRQAGRTCQDSVVSLWVFLGWLGENWHERWDRQRCWT